MKIAFAVLFCLFSPVANAQATKLKPFNFETVTLSNSDFTLGSGQTYSLDLQGWHHVAKLFIQAEGYYSDATFEVVVNGDTKGTVRVPGRDPSYVVTVGEVTNSIQFRQISGGNAHIRSVLAVETAFGLPITVPVAHPFGLPSANSVTEFAKAAIGIVNAYEPIITSENFSTYLLPIKVVAGRAFVMGDAHGELSQRAWESLNELEKQIEFADEYIKTTFIDENTFDLAVALESLKERLKDVLH